MNYKELYQDLQKIKAILAAEGYNLIGGPMVSSIDRLDMLEFRIITENKIHMIAHLTTDNVDKTIFDVTESVAAYFLDRLKRPEPEEVTP